MSLTSGRGPLSRQPAGRLDPPVPVPVTYVEWFPRRVRGLVDGRAVVDSEGVVFVHRSGEAPMWAFPAADVTGDVPTEPEPAAEGFVRVPWGAVDAWFEEDQQVVDHPRNPYHRVDCVPTSRHLRVEVAGRTLVDTSRTIGVYETSLPARLYVARDDVDMGLLVPSTTTSYCPYKGWASYWTAVVDGTTVVDVAWSYDDPLPECLPIAGMLSFYDHRATVVHDLPQGPHDLP